MTTQLDTYVDPVDFWRVWKVDNTVDPPKRRSRPRCEHGFADSTEDASAWCAQWAQAGKLCGIHLRSSQREVRQYDERPQGCTVDLGVPCGLQVLARSMCSKHYRRDKRGQTLVQEAERLNPVCGTDGETQEASDGE